MELNEERGESARSVSAGVTAPIEEGNSIGAVFLLLAFSSLQTVCENGIL